MKTLNPIEGIINQSVKMYLELCLLADKVYNLGSHSGPKRSILLFIGQRGEVSASVLAQEFPDPNNSARGRESLAELAKVGLISIDVRNSQTILTLTAAGKAKIQEIIKFEANLAQHLPSEVSIAELRRVTRTVEQLNEALSDYRSSYRQEQAEENSIKAS